MSNLELNDLLYKRVALHVMRCLSGVTSNTSRGGYRCMYPVMCVSANRDHEIQTQTCPRRIQSRLQGVILALRGTEAMSSKQNAGKRLRWLISHLYSPERPPVDVCWGNRWHSAENIPSRMLRSASSGLLAWRKYCVYFSSIQAGDCIGREPQRARQARGGIFHPTSMTCVLARDARISFLCFSDVSRKRSARLHLAVHPWASL